MKKNLFCSLLALVALAARSQVDNAVDQRVDARLETRIETLISPIQQTLDRVIWDTTLIKNGVSRTGSYNIDTVKTQAGKTVFVTIIVEGGASVIRTYKVKNIGGNYSVTAYQNGSWEGPAGTSLSASATSAGVVIKITGTSSLLTIDYARYKPKGI